MSPKSPLPHFSALIAAAALVSMPLQAAVVLDTFGPGSSSTGLGWSLRYQNSTPPNGQFLAVPFALDEASTITDIQASITGTGSFAVGIVAGAGLPSGAFVHSASVNSPITNVGLNGLSWTLAAGDFWLVTRPNLGAVGTWSGGGQPGTKRWAFTSSPSDASWTFTGANDAPAARIIVSDVPEPGNWALMLGGLSLLAAAARCRQHS